MLGGHRCLTVHYEDLCIEPEKTLVSIYHFLDISSELRTSVNRTKHIMGNQMRLGSLQDIRLDEKWKTTLSANEMELFKNLAGKLNLIHGYK
jgi:hypothetical protein